MKPTAKEALACLFAAAVFFSSGTRAEGRLDGNALDDESVKCLSCHDSTASEHYRLSVCSADDICDHPVGGDYNALASGNGSIKPAPNLNPAIKLKNGKIACTTCHVRYDDAEGHRRLTELRKRYPLVPDPMLVLDNRESQLCRSCHDGQGK